MESDRATGRNTGKAKETLRRAKTYIMAKGRQVSSYKILQESNAWSRCIIVGKRFILQSIVFRSLKVPTSNHNTFQFFSLEKP